MWRGLLKTMTDQKLLKEIRLVFDSVEFPSHLGIKAAELVDRWVSDSEVLKKATLDNDYHGPWYKVPEEHISGNGLGFNYLDPKGVIFYLPAFMTLAIKKPTYKNLTCIANAMSPPNLDEEKGELLFNHFSNRFALLNEDQKNICVKFLYCIKENLRTFSKYDLEDLEETISHKYWNGK